jgi:hypothetical protein
MGIHTLRFFPIGNADTTLISLSDGRHILWDYANMRDPNNKEDKRCDLPTELDKVVDNDFSVVTFTHADNDHINGFSDFFYLEHAKAYQGDERKKIDEIWVPAAVLVDSQAEDEAKILKAEARYRLKNKSGIKVFSRPKKMKKWCDDQDDISYEEVKDFFVDAGQLVEGFIKESDGIEFFAHAPFYSESQNLDRNGSAIVVQVTFNDKCDTKLVLGSDCTYEVWKDIVNITKHFNNDIYLQWDFFHISHHCSYLSLSSEKGKDETVPIVELKWLFELQGKERSRLISSSKPIPVKGSAEDQDSNPPHRQAANYYRDIATQKSGEFIVTMENPSESEPKPLIVEIDTDNCAKVIKRALSSAAIIGSSTAPRAGE